MKRRKTSASSLSDSNEKFFSYAELDEEESATAAEAISSLWSESGGQAARATWERLRGHYASLDQLDVLTSLLCNVVSTFPLPTTKTLSALELEAACVKLHDFDSTKLLKFDLKWKARHSDICSKIAIGVDLFANKISGMASDSERYLTGSTGQSSVALTWSDPVLRIRAAKKLVWHVNHPPPTRANWNRSIRWVSYLPAQFRVTAAKCLYDHFHATRVLDLCMGWGDRLAAALSCESVDVFVGTDVNTALQPAYTKIVEAILKTRLRAPSLIRRGTCPAEELTLLPEELFDVIFTSPPYYDRERYAPQHDSTQSYIRYSTYDTWLHDFLYPCVTLAAAHLATGGIMAWCVGSISPKHNIVDDLFRYVQTEISSKAGLTWFGAWGYLSHQNFGFKPQSSTLGTAATHTAEPILIWQKK